MATIKWHYHYDGLELLVPHVISSRGEQLLKAIWPFELWRENPRVLIKQFMDHWIKDMSAPLMANVTHDIFHQNVCNTTSPSSQKECVTFDCSLFVSMVTLDVSQVSVLVKKYWIEDLLQGAPSFNKVKFS